MTSGYDGTVWSMAVTMRSTSVSSARRRVDGVVRRDAQALADALEHPDRGSRFLLREHIDLKIEVRTPVRQAFHLVLADQDPDRQEDRLERHDEREEAERIGIERPHPRYQARVHGEPHDKPHQMDHGERRGARDANESCGTPRAERARTERIRLELGDPLDIATRHVGRTIFGTGLAVDERAAIAMFYLPQAVRVTPPAR